MNLYFYSWLFMALYIGAMLGLGYIASRRVVFANDMYRRSIAPRFHAHLSDAELDHKVLRISRIVTVLTLIGAVILGWSVMHMNIALLVWAGVGGFTAALMGPLASRNSARTCRRMVCILRARPLFSSGHGRVCLCGALCFCIEIHHSITCPTFSSSGRYEMLGNQTE